MIVILAVVILSGEPCNTIMFVRPHSHRNIAYTKVCLVSHYFLVDIDCSDVYFLIYVCNRVALIPKKYNSYSLRLFQEESELRSRLYNQSDCRGIVSEK